MSNPKDIHKDGFTLIYDDHERVKNLFSDWRKASTNVEKKAVIKTIIREVVSHATSEERYVYPLIKEEKIGGDGELFYARNLLDDQINKELLYFLDSQEPKTEAEWTLYNQTVEKFMTVELEHIQTEEKELQILRERLSEAQKAKLYDNLVWAKKTAPVHPHPMVSTNILTPVVGVIEQGVEKLKLSMHKGDANDQAIAQAVSNQGQEVVNRPISGKVETGSKQSQIGQPMSGTQIGQPISDQQAQIGLPMGGKDAQINNPSSKIEVTK